MTVYIVASTDGDSGFYNIQVCATLETAQQVKKTRNNAYDTIREYELIGSAYIKSTKRK